MNTTEMIATQQDLIDKGAEYLGDLIAWSICAETRLSEQTLKQTAQQVNLDFGYLPESPNKLSAFKNARTKKIFKLQANIQNDQKSVYIRFILKCLLSRHSKLIYLNSMMMNMYKPTIANSIAKAILEYAQRDCSDVMVLEASREEILQHNNAGKYPNQYFLLQ